MTDKTEPELVPFAPMSTFHAPSDQFTEAQLMLNPILRYFSYSHLPPALQAASKPFCDLARLMVETVPANAEREVALRKLIEAKDAAVRAALS